jgi:hypothetical protein
MKQDNPFAKLGALDQKLDQETTPKQEAPVSRKREVQVARITENQKPLKEEDKAFKVVNYQSADQSVDRSINQSTSQSTSQSTK